ncbi:glycosyltransferase [Psychrobacter alimentarius]|uniref:glycosyltransferase n=1 Tax=Psychrobacter alimentarius TaxID=261164 RepID=UPI003FD58990
MKKHKKIVLLVINCLQGGGGERFVLTLGQGFYELGYEVHILRFKQLVEYDLSPNLNYHVLKFKPYKLIPGSERRDKLFVKAVDRYVLNKIGQPDIILSNLYRADSILCHSKLQNIAYVIHSTLSLYHKFDKADNVNKLKSKLANMYSKHPCICVSDGVKIDFMHHLGDITSTIAIHNPIDKKGIQKLANAFVPKYQNYIIHVGSFKEAKRHDILIKAYAQTDQSMPLLLLGKGKLKDEIEQLVVALNLEEKVVFLGFQENPFPYVKHAKFKVLTSDREGFALVIAEALALNVPVISTDCQSGPKELLPANCLMPTNDVDAISEKINQAMSDAQQFYAPFDETILPVKIAGKYAEFMDHTKYTR